MNPAGNQEPRAWTARRWWTMVALVLMIHVSLIFALGARKLRPVRTVSHVPVLHWAAANDEFIALNDPTLFALPQANDFGAAIRTQTPAFNPRPIYWTEPAGWPPLAPEPPDRTFGRLQQSNAPPVALLDFEPAPQFDDPAVPALSALRQPSTLRLRGELAGRLLLAPPSLPAWPAADVIAPSKVQVLVDPAGGVVSAVLLPPDIGLESDLHDDQADQAALSLARAARFAPATRLTVGQMVFNWQTVPLPATNAPGTSP
jgi:hypothetical protein